MRTRLDRIDLFPNNSSQLTHKRTAISALTRMDAYGARYGRSPENLAAVSTLATQKQWKQGGD